MLQLSCHQDVKDDGCDNQDALHDGWPGRDNVIAYVQTEEAQKTQLSKVDTNHELLKSTCVETAFGVDVGVKSVEHVVAIRQIDKPNANSREAQDQRSYHCVGQCNHTQVGPLGIFSAPRWLGKSHIVLILLPWGFRKSAQDHCLQKADHVEEIACCIRNAIQDEIGDVEV